MAERVIAHALFDFINPSGERQIALHGETVKVDGAELERGERFGVFEEVPESEKPARGRRAGRAGAKPEQPPEVPADAEELVPDGDGDESNGDGGGDVPPEDAELSGDGPPRKAAAKDAWVDFAVSRRPDDVDEATARAAADALTKPELIEKYGA